MECASLKEQLTAAHEHYQRKLSDASHSAPPAPSSSSPPESKSAADSSSDAAAAQQQQQQQQQAASAAAVAPSGGNAQVVELARQVKELKDKLNKRNRCTPLVCAAAAAALALTHGCSDVRELKESTKATEDKLRSDLDTYRRKLAARDEEIKRLQLQVSQDFSSNSQPPPTLTPPPPPPPSRLGRGARTFPKVIGRDRSTD